MNKELSKKDWIMLSVSFILLIICIIKLPKALATLKGETPEECQAYTNLTTGGVYSKGKCYFREYDYYETRNVCNGVFFKSCYESSESHYESFDTTRCVIAKTGEPC